MAKRTKAEVPVIPADMVWAAACAAQRLNGRYLRAMTFIPELDRSLPANKELMRVLLSESESTIDDADYVQAAEIRTYWRNKLIEVLADNATGFTKDAAATAGHDEFKFNDWLAFGFIAYLIDGYSKGLIRDNIREQLDDAALTSRHFGKVGDKVSGKAYVIESHWSRKWETNYVTAVFENNLILFSYRDKLQNNDTIVFTGTVKAHRDNRVTQLNRVRIMPKEQK